MLSTTKVFSPVVGLILSIKRPHCPEVEAEQKEADVFLGRHGQPAAPTTDALHC